MTITTTTRNADLTDLMALLRDQHARKIDVVADASAISARDGHLVVRGTDPVLSEDGVTTGDGTYLPTAICDEGLAAKLGIPVAYLKTLRADRPDLYDANVNGWLHGRRPLMTTTGEERRPGIPADPRAFLVRCFRGDNPGETGIARAFLSDRYAPIDHIDVLMAALDGIREAGLPVNIDGGDLTERRMVVRVTCPEVSALAPALLAGYRSPFTGQTGAENPTVWAGFQITNSETGGGRFAITPRLVVQVCNNGMTLAADALERVHVGRQLDAGLVRYAAYTQEAATVLVRKQTRDAVTTFLSPDYLTGAIARLEERAQEPVADHNEVRTLTKGLRYTEAETDAILGFFTQGGQMTRAGVANAITAYSQTVEDGDAAYALEARAASVLL